MRAQHLDQGFLEAVRSGLAESGWEPARPLVVAISGGADSTALLLACATLAAENGGEVIAAHFDHRIRVDSAEDREFADQIAHLLGIRVVAGFGGVPAFARERSMSLETAARELRYRFLADAVEETRAQGVATGHTLDDQAETILLNMLRGAGTRGLSGMRRRTLRPAGPDWPAVTVLRPLLTLRHSECESACHAAGVEWIEDPSNQDPAFMRNRVRAELLPLAEQIRQGAAAALSRLARNVQETDALLQELAEAQAPIDTQGSSATVNRVAFGTLHPALQSHVLASMYEAATGGIEGLEQDHIFAMRKLASGASGTVLDLPGSTVFRVDYETCSIIRTGVGDESSLPPDVPASQLTIPGSVDLPGGFALTASIVDAPGDPAAFGPNTAHVRTKTLDGPFRVRARADGDRFHPLGMQSPMRLQDFLVNAHVPERFRDRIPIVESERGIVWVAGQRIADWAKLDGSSNKAIRLEFLIPPQTTP